MTFRATGYQPLPLSVWLGGLRAEIQARVSAEAQTTDQRYILARVLLLVSEELARADAGFFLALAQLDPQQAEGYWLSLVAARLGCPRIAGAPSRGLGRVTGTPGLEFTGAEEVRDTTTGLRWTVGPGTIGAGGSAVLPLRGLADLPQTFSLVPTDWQIKTELAGWTGAYATELTELGREAESDSALRARVLAVRGERPATEPGVIASLLKVSGLSLLGFVTNRTGSADDNGIPGHHFEAVLNAPPAPAAVGQALYGGASATAGTYGNRSVTIDGPYGPLTFRYSVGVDLRIYARIIADTAGAPGKVPEDLAAQLAAGLEAWSAVLPAGTAPIASAAETDLYNLLTANGAASPVTDLEVTFSLDNVSFASTVPVLLRQNPRVSNQPSAAVIVGTVPGPYVFTNADQIEIETPTSGGAQIVPFTGSETTIGHVVSLLAGATIGGLAVAATSEDPSATLDLRTIEAGSTQYITLGAATTANVLTALGLPAVPYTAQGANSDIEVTVLP